MDQTQHMTVVERYGPDTPRNVSWAAVAAIYRLQLNARGMDQLRARMAQERAAKRGAGLREIVEVYRREMEYTVKDKVREQLANDPHCWAPM